MSPCPFCAPHQLEVIHESDHVIGAFDRFPVSPGHALLITRRHVPTWFEANDAERQALLEAIDTVCRAVKQQMNRTVDGWNVGFNAGRAAGQTVDHLHLHVIPRWIGDVPDPRGGVRGVIPAKQSYPGPGART